ncbi:MAG: hypothetical protein A2V98_13465 [Planctomycetes bacterium RBG_16_64_12]|nr:MAG: hypothetical protein A2V98_13465 [Planctomycetes bacterium RBG_16_64_12]
MLQQTMPSAFLDAESARPPRDSGEKTSTWPYATIITYCRLNHVLVFGGVRYTTLLSRFRRCANFVAGARTIFFVFLAAFRFLVIDAIPARTLLNNNHCNRSPPDR